MVDLSVCLSGINLDNPIIPASGCFGYGEEFAQLYDINILGSFAIKGTTKNPRYGNQTPRIAETPSGMLNAVGLQNPGINDIADKKLKEIKGFFSKKIVANISGFSVDEFVYCAKKLNNSDNVGIVEVNISCPNVDGGGISFGTDAASAAQVTKAVKAVSTKPVYIKLSPNVTDIAEIAKVCEDAGADGLSLINTLLGMRIDIKSKKPILANITGGLSGPAVLPVALQMVYRVYEAVKIPIIGMGGVSSAEDVIEMMLAGASAVGIGAANLNNPYICKEIIEKLPFLADKLGIKKLKDITGGAHK